MAPSHAASARPGGQGLFRPEDNLESLYARDALRQLYLLIVRGKIDGCSLDRFQSATGLKLMDDNGIKDDLPPITTFLNRLLALTIELKAYSSPPSNDCSTPRCRGRSPAVSMTSAGDADGGEL